MPANFCLPLRGFFDLGYDFRLRKGLFLKLNFVVKDYIMNRVTARVASSLTARVMDSLAKGTT